jgi:hypothetical protein
MDSEAKLLSEISDGQFESNEFIVSDLTKVHHFFIVGIGIVPFVIASIWYSVVF